jgi:hypothetical protein
MSEEDLEQYEADMEMQLYREYRDVLPMFAFVVETERRFYLANKVEVVREQGERLELELSDAWVWDVYRTSRFAQRVRVLTTKDVNIEELSRKDDLPEPPPISAN